MIKIKPSDLVILEKQIEKVRNSAVAQKCFTERMKEAAGILRELTIKRRQGPEVWNRPTT